MALRSHALGPQTPRGAPVGLPRVCWRAASWNEHAARVRRAACDAGDTHRSSAVAASSWSSLAQSRDVVRDLGVTEQPIYSWRGPDRIDRLSSPAEPLPTRPSVLRPGSRSGNSRPSSRSRLGQGVAQGAAGPKRRFAAIKVMAAEELPVEVCCRVLGVSVAGYYRWLIARPSERAIPHGSAQTLVDRGSGGLMLRRSVESGR